jgi:hypothetical protein
LVENDARLRTELQVEEVDKILRFNPTEVDRRLSRAWRKHGPLTVSKIQGKSSKGWDFEWRALEVVEGKAVTITWNGSDHQRVYSGTVNKDQQPHGVGRYYTCNGSCCIEAQFFEGKIHGYARLIF